MEEKNKRERSYFPLNAGNRRNDEDSGKGLSSAIFKKKLLIDFEGEGERERERERERN